MQNKANLPDIQMNVSYVETKNYEQKTMDNEPTKQTQSKPISPTSAARAYDEAAKKLRGEFAVLNFDKDKNRIGSKAAPSYKI